MKPASLLLFERSPYYLFDRFGLFEILISRKKAVGNLPLYILGYHRFTSSKQVIPSIPKSIDQAAFKAQIEYLCKYLEPIPLSLLAYLLQERKPLPKNAIVITIDDGYKDNYIYAYPILKKYKVPATIFIVTSHIGGKQVPWESKVSFAVFHTSLSEISLEEVGTFDLNGEKKRYNATKYIIKKLKRFTDRKKDLLVEKLIELCKVHIPEELGKKMMLSWEEIKEMSENGIEFGSHTITHPVLTRIPLREAKREIEGAKKEIEERLGKKVVSFAYPSGIYDREIMELVKKSGYLCSVTTRLDEIKRWSSPWELGRVMGIDEDFSKFKAVLSGVYYKLNRCWGLIR